MVTPNRVEQIVRPAKTGGYVPQVWSGSNALGQALDGRPRFTWLEVERMRYDPQIQFGLRILRAPLFGVTWKVSADSDVMQRWIDREFGKIYRRMVPRLVRAFEYGCAAGEVVYQERRSKSTGRTRIHFSDFLDLHPRDARPLVYHRGRLAGSLAGIRVSHVQNAEAGTGGLFLDRRHGFWFSGEAEYGAWYGRPRLAGAHEPWLEKRGRHGAIDARRLFYKKCAFRGPRVRYPVGTTDMGTAETGPMPVSNQDIARELVEKFENGGVLALPSVKLPDGGDAWTWEDPQAFADVAGLLEYPRQLDKEILIGFGIPPELVEAAQVGSGYSGRAIPAQVFFTSMDEFVQLVVEAIDTQVMRFLVRLNFGKGAGYEIVPDSLAQMIANSGQGGGPGAPGQPPSPGGPMPNGMIPYQGPRGGHGMKDPRTGRVHYGQEPPSSYMRLSHTQDVAEEPVGDELPVFDPATFWTESDSQVLGAEQTAPKRGAVRMSWTPYTGPRGGTGWVSDYGEIRYQEARPDDSEAHPERGPETLFETHPDAKLFSGDISHDLAHARRTVAGLPAQGIDPKEYLRRVAFYLDKHMESSPGDRGDDLKLAHNSVLSLMKGEKRSRDDREQTRREVEEADRKRAELEAKAPQVAQRFTDEYFGIESAKERAGLYLHMVNDEDIGGYMVENLDQDTKDAIADDLAELPAEQLAQTVAVHLNHYWEQAAEYQIAKKAGEIRAAKSPVKSEPIGPGDVPDEKGFYKNPPRWVTSDEIDPAGLRLAAQFLPGALRTKFLPASAGMLVRGGSPLDAACDHLDEKSQVDTGYADDENNQQELFDALQSAFEVPQTDVPASAKNYGGVSGAGGSGDFEPESDWNPDDVPVYKRLDDDWYMVRWGDAHPSETGFSFVHRSKVPHLSRLPDPYWDGFNTSVLDDKGNIYQNSEGAERNEKRLNRSTGDEADTKKSIKQFQADIRGVRSEIRKARDEWHRALAGVPEDKRPDEPDWDDRPDESALTDQHDDRASHESALMDLYSELEAHRDGLRKQIEDAKNFADKYHNRRNAKNKKKPVAPAQGQVQASRDELQAIRDAIAAGGDPASALAKLDALLKRAAGG